MNIVRWVAGYGDATRLSRMFELAMTAHGGDERPAIVFEKLENITNLHSSDMIGEPTENQKPYNV